MSHGIGDSLCYMLKKNQKSNPRHCLWFGCLSLDVYGRGWLIEARLNKACLGFGERWPVTDHWAWPWPHTHALMKNYMNLFVMLAWASGAAVVVVTGLPETSAHGSMDILCVFTVGGPSVSYDMRPPGAPDTSSGHFHKAPSLYSDIDFCKMTSTQPALEARRLAVPGSLTPRSPCCFDPDCNHGKNKLKEAFRGGLCVAASCLGGSPPPLSIPQGRYRTTDWPVAIGSSLPSEPLSLSLRCLS